jgi:MATE family multidrug resistance protein
MSPERIRDRRSAPATPRAPAAPGRMVGHWALGVPAAVLLAFGAGLGVVGLWWGFVVGLTAVGASLLARYLRVSAREIVPLADRAPEAG